MGPLKRKATDKEQEVLGRLTELYESDGEKTNRVNQFLKALVEEYKVDKGKARKLRDKSFITILELADLTGIFITLDLITAMSNLIYEGMEAGSVDVKLQDETILRLMGSGFHTIRIFGVFKPNGKKWVMRTIHMGTDLKPRPLSTGVQKVKWDHFPVRKERYCGVSLKDLSLIANDEEKEFITKIAFQMGGSKEKDPLGNVTYDYKRKELVVVDMK